ncbi:MAG: nucleotide exchange factor GrpE [Patescibacteria group bacterium]
MEELKKGIYRHYKGGEYKVINEVINTENQEAMVVYQDISDENKIWVRPKSIFLESVDVNGKKQPRFKFLKEIDLNRHPEAVVGPLIYNAKGEILLIKNPKFGDFWTIPGGHIELDEPAEEALKREIMEETSLELKNIEPIAFSEGINPEFFFKPKHFIYLNYLAELAGGEITKSNEMTEYLWITPEEALKLKVSSSVVPLIEYYLEKQSNGDSWEHQYKRALADYQNLLKQTVKDKEEFVKYALGNFLQDIIPVYDHLKLSIMGLSEEEGNSPWAIGVRHVLKQFKDILEARGIEEIKTVGEKFDHNTMEAMEGTGEIVKQEIMAGYKLNGRVIKPARVIVN